MQSLFLFQPVPCFIKVLKYGKMLLRFIVDQNPFVYCMKHLHHIMALIAILFNLNMVAQPGALFTSFANGGVLISPPMQDTLYDNPRSIAILPDNKIVTSGYSNTFDFYQAYLAKFNQNGTPDSSFGNNGVVMNDFTPFSQYTDIATEPDGKIVVAGVRSNTFSSQGHDCFVARYNQNGTLDNGFGSSGVFTTALSAATDGIMRIIRLTDGRYLCLARYGSGAAGIAALIMLTDSGSLDPTFAGSGIKTHLFSNVAPQGTSDIALSGDGKILALGGGDGVIKVAKFTLSGSVDSSFGNNGTVTVPTGRHLRVNTDGSILVFGESTVNGNQAMTTHKFLSNGAPDTFFGSNGTATYTTTGLTQFFNSLSRPLLYPDGRYLRTWRHLLTINGEQKRKVAVTWFNPNGSLATIGEVIHDISPTPAQYSDQQPEQIVMDANGDVFSMGYYQTDISGVQYINKYHGDLSITSAPEKISDSWLTYPNPAQDVLYFTANNTAQIKTVTIHDNVGRTLGQYTPANSQLNISHLQAGMYLVTITSTTNQTQTVKVIKH